MVMLDVYAAALITRKGRKDLVDILVYVCECVCACKIGEI